MFCNSSVLTGKQPVERVNRTDLLNLRIAVEKLPAVA
jgi:hypothetical protein